MYCSELLAREKPVAASSISMFQNMKRGNRGRARPLFPLPGNYYGIFHHHSLFFRAIESASDLGHPLNGEYAQQPYEKCRPRGRRERGDICYYLVPPNAELYWNHFAEWSAQPNFHAETYTAKSLNLLSINHGRTLETFLTTLLHLYIDMKISASVMPC